MPDKLFFPLAAILAALLVFLALQPAMGALPTGAVSVGDGNYSEVTVSGVELNRINAGGDVRIDLIQDGDPVHLQIEAVAGSLPDDPLLGPHFVLAEDIEFANSGITIEVSVVARAGERLGAERMRVNYSAGRDGESGWETFDLTREWGTYSFTYDVPLKTGERALDYLAIRPVTPDKTRSLEIAELRMVQIRRWTDGDPQG